jgi:hypothetical protein
MSSSGLPPKRNSAPVFQPRFVLSLLYLAAFFVFYCFVLMAPQLIEVLNTVPTGPEQQELAEQVARETLAPRLPIVIALTLVTLGVLGYYQRLPGLRASS